MSIARLDKLIWVLVFAGMLTAGLGIAVRRQGAGWGTVLVVLGSLVTVLGFVLIWVRSRMEPPPPPKERSR